MDNLYYRSMGKLYKVEKIARTVAEANEFCSKRADVGVIDDQKGWIIIASNKPAKIAA